MSLGFRGCHPCDSVARIKQTPAQTRSATPLCHPAKARIIVRDPYSMRYLNHRGWTHNSARATVFKFEQWSTAIAECESKGVRDIDFLLTFPGISQTICLRVRAAGAHPLVDYASL
jgi:hypothetical protein